MVKYKNKFNLRTISDLARHLQVDQSLINHVLAQLESDEKKLYESNGVKPELMTNFRSQPF